MLSSNTSPFWRRSATIDGVPPSEIFPPSNSRSPVRNLFPRLRGRLPFACELLRLDYLLVLRFQAKTDTWHISVEEAASAVLKFQFRQSGEATNLAVNLATAPSQPFDRQPAGGKTNFIIWRSVISSCSEANAKSAAPSSSNPISFRSCSDASYSFALHRQMEEIVG
jgi:hypothetical protein